MNRNKWSALAAIFLAAAMNAENLPVKEILGQQYYVYEVKKGDSVYGITHKYGWDESEFIRLNPSAAEGLKKGETVYYPIGKVAAAEIREPSVSAINPADLPVLTHNVKRGETVYSIAKLYDIPISVIYDAHPSARTGIKAGETISINQNQAGFGTSEKLPFFFIQVKPGDTLYSTAKQYGLAVEDLMSSNPGVTEYSFKAGSWLKVPASGLKPRLKRTLVEEQTIGAISSYTVNKDDNWTSISRKTGVAVEDLKSANSEVKHLKKNEVLAVPEVTTVQVEKEVPYTDPREENAEGRKEIYDSIHHISDQSEVRNVRIALIMDDPDSKRDIEFTRGFLLALKQLGNPGYKVDVKVLAANLPAADIVADLEGFAPQLVFTLSEKGAADWLLSYAGNYGIETVNVFDTKNDTYTSMPSVIQLLTPTAHFNESIASTIGERYADRKLLTVTKGVEADMLAEAVGASFGNKGLKVQIDNLNPSLFPAADDILILADITDKADVEKLFAQIAVAKENNPLLNATVVGRPNWVTFADSMTEQFYDNDVVVPSRFFFNPESETGKTFISDFTAVYERGPLKSYPNYAATGYDSANWFIPALAINEGDFNVTVPKNDLLQMPIDLHRISNWGGFYNSGAVLIHFTPWRTIETDNI